MENNLEKEQLVHKKFILLVNISCTQARLGISTIAILDILHPEWFSDSEPTTKSGNNDISEKNNQFKKSKQELLDYCKQLLNEGVCKETQEKINLYMELVENTNPYNSFQSKEDLQRFLDNLIELINDFDINKTN